MRNAQNAEVQRYDEDMKLESTYRSKDEISSHLWIKTKLEDICFLRTGLADPSKKSDCRYVGLEHIDSGVSHLSRWGWSAEVKSAKTLFHAGDILYGKLRPYLNKAILAHFEGICSTDILVLAPKPAVDPAFLSYLLHTHAFTSFAVQTMRGVNHPRTSWSSLASFELFTPPFSEQEVIARVLQTLQEAIQARYQEIELEREQKTVLISYIFTYGTGNDTTSLRKTKFGETPAYWELKPLEQCAFVQTGVTKGRKLTGTETITLPYLRVANVQDGYLDLTEMKEIELRTSEVERYTLHVGDVVVTEGGDFDKLGRGFLWQGQLANCVHQNHIFAVRVNQELLLPEYFAYLIQSDYGRAYFLSVAHRTTNLASINSTKLKNFPILIPPLEEQRDIAQILDACDTKISSLDRELALLEELFHALLEELMAGRISTIPPIEEERAS